MLGIEKLFLLFYPNSRTLVSPGSEIFNVIIKPWTRYNVPKFNNWALQAKTVGKKNK